MTFFLTAEISRPGAHRKLTISLSRKPCVAPGTAANKATNMSLATSCSSSIVPKRISNASAIEYPSLAISWVIASVREGLMARISDCISSLLRLKSYPFAWLCEQLRHILVRLLELFHHRVSQKISGCAKYGIARPLVD
jgi:hypothetical protein